MGGGGCLFTSGSSSQAIGNAGLGDGNSLRCGSLRREFLNDFASVSIDL